MTKFEVKEFRFLSPNDPVDMSYDNWSRCYEWKWVLDKLRGYSGSVHNTCCGTKEIHGQFCRDLDAACPDVTHSDFIPTEFHLDRFQLRDATKEWPSDEFDCVVCVSTLEEIPETEKALTNVIRSAKSRVLLTFDYPHVDLAMVQRIVGREIDTPSDSVLDGFNSKRPAPHYQHLNVVVLELQSK